MSKEALKWVILIGLILFQWYILGSWIYREEQTMLSGQFIKIPCQQVDPKDPFRGTYLQINPIPAQFEFTDSLQYSTNQFIWINYEPDSADIYRFHSVQPDSETPLLPVYIRARIQYIYPLHPDSLFTAGIEYPFTHLYVNEKAAPQLVEQYNKALSDTTVSVYAGVYVLKGKTALAGLWVNNLKLE